MLPTTQSPLLIYSSLGGDPDLGELVEMFVDEMPARVAAFQVAFDRADYAQLRSLAHQLKGAAGSYGFHELTPAALELEVAARDSDSPSTIEPALDRLIGLCVSTRAGVAPVDVR